MKGNRTSRGGALLIALGVQSLIALLFGLGLRWPPVAADDAPAMTVTLVPVLHGDPDPRAGTPKVHVHLQDPGIPAPVVPADIVLSPTALPESPADSRTVIRTIDQESAGSTFGTESDINIVSRVLPDYPQAAVDRQAQGTTSVAILVNAKGHPGAVRVLQSSGDADLDAAAVRAVQKWQFTPATADSQVVAKWGRLAVNFNLTDYRRQHPQMHSGSHGEDHDPVSRLGAVIRSWIAGPGVRPRNFRDERSLELLNPVLRRSLQKFGPVRSIRSLGAVSRPPDGVAVNNAQTLRGLNSSGVVAWDVFEVTQLRGRSQWYCAVDAAGEIHDILINDDANLAQGEHTRALR